MMSYAYILRKGSIVGLLPVGVKGVMNKSPIDLPIPVVLEPGDVVRAMTSTASSRLASIYAVGADGSQRIYTVTPSGAATNEPVDLQTSNSLGDTQNGTSLTMIMTTSIDGNKINGGGAIARNEVGQVVGCNPASNPTAVQPRFTMVNIPVGLNYKWALVTSS